MTITFQVIGTFEFAESPGAPPTIVVRFDTKEDAYSVEVGNILVPTSPSNLRAQVTGIWMAGRPISTADLDVFLRTSSYGVSMLSGSLHELEGLEMQVERAEQPAASSS